MRDRPGFQFSFSGLKTAVLLASREQPLDDPRRAAIARGVQDAIVDILCARSLRALRHADANALVVAGGVGANRELRERLTRECAAIGARVYFPRFEFCTDNAAMIAVAGLARLAAGERAGATLGVRARWPLTELRPPGAIDLRATG